MIVWGRCGGQGTLCNGGLGDAGRYTVDSDLWTSISTASAPAARPTTASCVDWLRNDRLGRPRLDRLPSHPARGHLHTWPVIELLFLLPAARHGSGSRVGEELLQLVPSRST